MKSSYPSPQNNTRGPLENCGPVSCGSGTRDNLLLLAQGRVGRVPTNAYGVEGGFPEVGKESWAQ